MREPLKWINLLNYLIALCLIEIGINQDDLEVDLTELKKEGIPEERMLQMLLIMTVDKVFIEKNNKQQRMSVIEEIIIQEQNVYLNGTSKLHFEQYKKLIIKTHKITKEQLKTTNLNLSYGELIDKHNLRNKPIETSNYRRNIEYKDIIESIKKTFEHCKE